MSDDAKIVNAIFAAAVVVISVLIALFWISGASLPTLPDWVGGMISLLLLLGVSLGAYFLPTIIALARGHRNAAAIGLLNLFLGWTLVGWVAALVWSALADQRARAR